MKSDKRLKIENGCKDKFHHPSKYADAVEFQPSGTEKIAVIYAEGNILDGKGDRGQIGGETYMQSYPKSQGG